MMCLNSIGTLLLESIGWLEISRKQQVEAAAHLCPLLMKVRAFGSEYSTDPPLSPSLVQNIWPQVRKFGCNISVPYFSINILLLLDAIFNVAVDGWRESADADE